MKAIIEILRGIRFLAITTFCLIIEEIKQYLRVKVRNRKPTKILTDKKEIISEIKTGTVSLLDYASQEIKADKEVILEAVKHYGWALSYGSDELKADKEVVSEAVSQYGRALQYASDELRNDRKIVLKAIENNGIAFMYISEEFKNDIDIVLAALFSDISMYHFVGTKLKNNHAVINSLINSSEYIKESVIITKTGFEIKEEVLNSLTPRYGKVVTMNDLVNYAPISSITEEDMGNNPRIIKVASY